MNHDIEVGDLVFCYPVPELRGRCEGPKIVSEIKIVDGISYYRMTSVDGIWYTINQLLLAQRPPAGTETKFKIGDRVRCFGTYHVYYATATIEHIVWFEGQPDYYVTPTETPWYPHSEDSLELAKEVVSIMSEWENTVF